MFPARGYIAIQTRATVQGVGNLFSPPPDVNCETTEDEEEMGEKRRRFLSSLV